MEQSIEFRRGGDRLLVELRLLIKPVPLFLLLLLLNTIYYILNTDMEAAMESFLELSKTRRSIRKYSGQKVLREDLEKCVEAARYSPSACNSQPWKFLIVDDPAMLEAVARASFPDLYNMNAFAKEASAFICIIGASTKPPAWLGGKLRRTDFRKIDIGISCAHLVLEARDLGLGTCILGWFDERKLKRLLGVPYVKKIELLIAVGYPSSTALREKAMKKVNEVISFNGYGT